MDYIEYFKTKYPDTLSHEGNIDLYKVSSLFKIYKEYPQDFPQLKDIVCDFNNIQENERLRNVLKML
jgi:hypothetical protein